jgi:hypothetical protein
LQSTPIVGKKIRVAARIFAKTELFGNQISPGMLNGMIFLLVLSLVRAKSRPDMRNPEVFRIECNCRVGEYLDYRSDKGKRRKRCHDM